MAVQSHLLLGSTFTVIPIILEAHCKRHNMLFELKCYSIMTPKYLMLTVLSSSEQAKAQV